MVQNFCTDYLTSPLAGSAFRDSETSEPTHPASWPGDLNDDIENLETESDVSGLRARRIANPVEKYLRACAHQVEITGKHHMSVVQGHIGSMIPDMTCVPSYAAFERTAQDW